MTAKAKRIASRTAGMRNVIKAAIVALVLMLAVPVAAQDFEAGLEAYERGDYVAALNVYRPLAEQGNAQAQYHLGLMYENGHGMAQDNVEALNWYSKAAEQGHASAQNNLGAMYDKGRGVPQDDAEAAKWYTKAAAQGVIFALNNLGLKYAMGLGVPQDYAHAVKLFRLAAENGDASAQSNLGRAYAEGLGVGQDYIQALMWFILAAASSIAPDDERDMAVMNRDFAASLMSSEQIAEAQKLAREWKPK